MGMFETGVNNEVRLMWEQVNHVPLILYQPGQFEHLTVADRLFISYLQPLRKFWEFQNHQVRRVYGGHCLVYLLIR